MSQRIVQVDAFTDRPFTGNPAAVCVMEGPAEVAWMQAVAREMNLSETAFLHPEPDVAPGIYRLRWFTPLTEVDLCGHATLSAAHVLWEEGYLSPDQPAIFQTRSGQLVARRRDRWIVMDFPAEPVIECPFPPGLVRALGIEPQFVGRNRMDVLAELPTEAIVRSLAPDFRLLAEVSARGVIVTAPAHELAADFVSRFFSPRIGVNEDPVCGSAHCALGPYWGQRLGRDQVIGMQVSARGGTVHVGLRGDRVDLAGRAITVMRGELC